MLRLRASHCPFSTAPLSTFRWTTAGKRRTGSFCSKTRPTTTPPRSSPSAARPPASGGAIRDPLSGRAYVYPGHARHRRAAIPPSPFEETLPGKLPQPEAGDRPPPAGYSSYGNQIGLATGQVTELYDPGYVAKRMEIGAVVGASPKANVRREAPVPGDVVILLGGRTGRDGMRRRHRLLQGPHGEEPGAPAAPRSRRAIAPEERKLQRLFRDGEVARLIKRCNDFGAGGVSVAIGELADGLDIDLDAVPKKVRGPGRHRTGHLREPGAHGRGGGAPGRADAFIAAGPAARIWRPPWWPW